MHDKEFWGWIPNFHIVLVEILKTYIRGRMG